MRHGWPLILLLALVTGACSGAGAGSSAAPATSAPAVPTASMLPRRGTVMLPDRRIYTVAPPGRTLRLDDLALRVRGIRWNRHLQVGFVPLGTHIFAVLRVTITNRSDSPARVLPTQIWLLDTAAHTYLSVVASRVPDQLVGKLVDRGATASGTIVFALPRRVAGGLLVYRFADAAAIAHAHHVGVARYPGG